MSDFWGSLLADDEFRDDFDAEDIAGLSDDQTLNLIATTRALMARLEAVQVMALTHFGRLRARVRGTDDEIAYELRCSRHTAGNRISTAELVVERHPGLLEAMRDGELDGYTASRVVDATAHLSDADARQVDALLEERLDGNWAGKNPTAIRRLARRFAHQVDPDGMAQRAGRARRHRRVELHPGEDTMSTLVADLRAEVASAAYAAIDREARRLRTTGDERTLDQLRADILGERLIGNGGETGKPRVQVMLHMPIGTALAITDHGCELDGYGPIPGPIARQIMADENSIWRKVICDPATGAVQDLGRTRYRPTAAIRQIVAVRDRECLAPGCDRPAIHSDFDHLHARRRGGGTSVHNGDPACEYHNNLKEQPGWRIQRTNTTTTITTPTGRTYTQQRETIHEPEPPLQRRKPPTLPDEPPF